MRRTGWLAVAVGLVLLLDILRVWLPSVIFVYARAGSTPAAEMAAFGLAPFLLMLVVGLVLGFVRPAAVALAGIAVMAGARVALQATEGGDPQLWLATIGIVAGLGWLVAVAGGTVPPAVAGLGLAAGMAADTTLHALLRSTGLAWRTGIGWWVAVLVLAGAAVLLTWQAYEEPTQEPGAARGWLLVGPVLLVHALVAGVPSRLHTITGWPEPVAVGVVLAGWALAMLAAWWTLAGAHEAGRAGAVLVVLGFAATHADAALLVAVGHLLLPVGLAVCVTAAVVTPGRASPLHHGVSAAGGLVLLGVFTFTYYAAYDITLGFPNTAVVALAALVVCVVAVTGRAGEPTTGRPPVWAGVGLLVVALVATGGVALASAPPQPETGEGFPVRLMLYNLQMGFDIHGRQAVDAQAAVIAEQDPDIVVLNEVSRGWLINAATDTLPRIADQVGLAWHFAPAADRVWGNALLTRYPVLELRSGFLPHEPVAMRRGYISAVLDLGGGAELGVIGTHLTHVAEGADVRAAQIRALVAEAQRLAEGGRPVAVVGDLNAEPGDPELAPLDDYLTDVSEGRRPLGTHPSWEPDRIIDHVYVSPELRAFDYRVPETTASDHLPVVVTLTR